MTITTEAPQARRKRRVSAAGWWWLLVLPATLWVGLRSLGWERGPLVQLFAFTPYAALWALLPALLTVARRRWTHASVALMTLLAFVVLVLPRAIPDADRGPTAGPALHVMTVNMLAGEADAATIVGLVRDHDVAVLAVQEFTGDAAGRLAAAGLTALLPNAALGPQDDTSGSALYSRHPITDFGVRRNGGGFHQAYATVHPPGAAPVAMESVHPLAPYAVGVLRDWRADLTGQPRATPDGPVRILLGDFNATLDHTPLRQLLRSGYRDAADTSGNGLLGTWGPYDGLPVPPVTIDHVLVDRRVGVREVSVHDIERSDHRAVIAYLTLPAR